MKSIYCIALYIFDKKNNQLYRNFFILLFEVRQDGTVETVFKQRYECFEK